MYMYIYIYIYIFTHESGIPHLWLNSKFAIHLCTRLLARLHLLESQGCCSSLLQDVGRSLLRLWQGLEYVHNPKHTSGWDSLPSRHWNCFRLASPHWMLRHSAWSFFFWNPFSKNSVGLPEMFIHWPWKCFRWLSTCRHCRSGQICGTWPLQCILLSILRGVGVYGRFSTGWVQSSERRPFIFLNTIGWIRMWKCPELKMMLTVWNWFFWKAFFCLFPAGSLLPKYQQDDEKDHGSSYRLVGQSLGVT